MDRARPAIQSQPPPIPELEGKDVGSRADLENHAVAPRTVNGAGGDEEVVMFTGRPRIHIFLCVEGAGASLGGPQLGSHLLPVDSLPQPKIDNSASGPASSM